YRIRHDYFRGASIRPAHPRSNRVTRRTARSHHQICGWREFCRGHAHSVAIIQRGIVDGAALCRMFQHAIRCQALPKYLSTDNDPVYRFHQWQANLRVLELTEIKTLPGVPLSHPFVERLIGTIRRECLDRTLFWTATDLEQKLQDFQHYFNKHRAHDGLGGR